MFWKFAKNVLLRSRPSLALNKPPASNSVHCLSSQMPRTTFSNAHFFLYLRYHCSPFSLHTPVSLYSARLLHLLIAPLYTEPHKLHSYTAANLQHQRFSLRALVEMHFYRTAAFHLFVYRAAVNCRLLPLFTPLRYCAFLCASL